MINCIRSGLHYPISLKKEESTKNFKKDLYPFTFLSKIKIIAIGER